MTISCSLGPQLKEEALSIEIKLLLNTEILKIVRHISQCQLIDFIAMIKEIATRCLFPPPQDSSSVIQFVTRGSVEVNDRAVEVPNGLPEEISVSTSSATEPDIFFSTRL